MTVPLPTRGLCENPAMSELDAPPAAPKRWSLPRLLALAFAAGLVLFVIVWLSSRHDYDFYTPGDTATAQDPNATLPAPIAPDLADGNSASGLRVDAAPSAATPPPTDAPGIVQRPSAPAAPATPAPDPSTATSDRTTPIPLTHQPPRYPTVEQRRGIGGIVWVQIHVAIDGSVESNDIATSSGSRNLDRAALEATRRWTFQPALRNGQPIAADVVVPIEFRAR